MARILLAESRPLSDEALEALLPGRGKHETEVLVLGDDHGGALLFAVTLGGAAGVVAKTCGAVGAVVATRARRSSRSHGDPQDP